MPRFLPKFLFAFLFSALLFSPLHADTITADTITIVADSWCPYNCDPKSANPGYGIEIAKEIFEKAGHRVNYHTQAWQSALKAVKQGEATAAIGVTYNDSPELLFPQQPIGISQDTLIARSDMPFDYRTVESLDGHVLGAMAGYAYDPAFNTYIEKYKNDKTRLDLAEGDHGFEINLKKLVDKKLDLVLEDFSVANFVVKNLKMESLVTLHAVQGKRNRVYLAFSPKNPKSQEYSALLDKGIAQLRASGRLAQILKKYGLEDWQESKAAAR